MVNNGAGFGGAGLVAAAGASDSGTDGGWAVLRMVLEDASRQLTRRDVLSQWPQDHPKPSPQSLWNWLDRAVAAGLVARDGASHRNAPFLYWLPEREAELEYSALPRLEPLSPLD
jgi:hypothetical protein